MPWDREKAWKILFAFNPLTWIRQLGSVLAWGQCLGPGLKERLDANNVANRTNHCPAIPLGSSQTHFNPALFRATKIYPEVFKFRTSSSCMKSQLFTSCWQNWLAKPKLRDHYFFSNPTPTTHHHHEVTSKSATIISKLLELWNQALQDSSDIHAVACIWSANVGITVRHSIPSPNGHQSIKGPNFFIQWSIRSKPDYSTLYS